MSQELATLTLDPNIIKPIIEAKINTAVLEAMKGHEAIVDNIVHRVLYHKVDSDGQVDRYGYAQSKTFIDWLVEKGIREAVIAAMKTHMEQCQPAIKKAIEGELKKSTSKLASTMIESMIENTVKQWKYAITVNTAS